MKLHEINDAIGFTEDGEYVSTETETEEQKKPPKMKTEK